MVGGEVLELEAETFEIEDLAELGVELGTCNTSTSCSTSSCSSCSTSSCCACSSCSCSSTSSCA